ncbi:MAG: protein-L-isoaspartate(D-aspartate) O-methyltransferase [Anaerolineaceae bacterium]
MMEADFTQLRTEMVERQIKARGIHNQRILDAMLKIPRHEVVPEELRHRAYEDRPLSIGEEQTISQPYIVALMSSLLQPEASDKVLEIGTGSGYQAAILSELVQVVYTLEQQPLLAENAQKILALLKIDNVFVICTDGTLGLPEQAPYDKIIITAAAPGVPQPLLNQLAVNGRLILPVGGSGNQILQIWERTATGFLQEDSIPVRFVPLRGKYGWSEDDWQSQPD